MLANSWSELQNNKKFTVKKACLYKEEKKLVLSIEANKKDFSDIEDSCRVFFKKYFPEIEIIVKFNNKSNDSFSSSYLASLKDKIITENPSCKTYDFSLSYLEEKNLLNIKVANKTIKDQLEKKQLDKILKNRIKEECNKTLDVSFSLENDIDFKVFLQERREKEKAASKKLMAKQKPKSKSKRKKNESFYIGKKIKDQAIKLDEINSDTYKLTAKGKIYGIDARPIKNNMYIVTFYLHDTSSAISCKAFWSEEIYERFDSNVKEDDGILVSGRYMMDSYQNCYVLTVESMTYANIEEKIDNSSEKRVELRLHSQMSTYDGFVDLEKLYEKLALWGHRSIAITDNNVVQSFPQAMELSEDFNIKSIYGLDANVSEDFLPIVMGSSIKDSFVVYDIETTGLSNLVDRITEIGAIKVKDGKIIDSFSSLVNPEKLISEKIVKLTGITNAMVAGAKKIDEVLPDFLKFCEGSTLVAHNAEFDISHIRTNAKRLGLNFDFSYIDTLYLARFLLPNLKNHKLGTLSKALNVKLLNHHRAVDDAKATADIFIELQALLKKKGLELLPSLNYEESDWPATANNNYDALLLVKKQEGLKNLYKIVTESHTEDLYKGPKITESHLRDHREGILIGSGNLNGRLYRAIFTSMPKDYIERIAKDYDFLEVQPRSNFTHLLGNSNDRMGIESLDYIDRVNKYIVDLGDKLSIPVVASGDVFYLNKGDHIFRNIVKTVQFKSWKKKFSENLYLKTTEEMLEEFSYLGDEKAKEIVITNTNRIADSIDDIRPIPSGKFPPHLDGAEEELRESSFKKAKEIYGDPLPKIVEDRLRVELKSIISNGYAVLYIIARKLVAKSIEDGYLVGSRGSVGSSLVATMSGITEVNPLPAHYICTNCKHSEFVDENLDTGLDLKDKNCPICGKEYKKDGHNIPFEVFLGFEGNKEPDIDLNFASEEQPVCHKYTEELFGKDHVFRAGTIGTIADNTAYGYIKKYYEKFEENINQAEIAYLQKGIVGTKRTTGQHPGGIMIVPHNYEIEEFTPVNYPADDPTTGIKTTHFAYSSIEKTILKLDLLGHDVPSIIKSLQDLTGVDPNSIKLDDKDTMSLFSNLDTLNLKEEISERNVGTLGIPEFGTHFVRQMLTDTKPKTMGELFRISGLSHGTDVWMTNAQDLVRDGKAVLREVICTRDDIMTFLISKGMESNMAFTIMERVRKGRQNKLTDEHFKALNQLDLPDWYIDSCMKIKYMFPKAHAVAYVLMSYRIAYFKVHYPEAFYASYFTTKLSDFPGKVIFSGLSSVQNEMKRIKSLGKDASNKELNQYTVLEVAEEMYARGYGFSKLELSSLNKDEFTLNEANDIVPPYCAIDDVSSQHSIDIYEACKDGNFLSIEDLVSRSGINKTAVEGLKRQGLLRGLQDTNQIDIFSMLD